MKRCLLAVALVAISSAAFAQGAGPTRMGNKCFVLTDYRGFGYWTPCPTLGLIQMQGEPGKAAPPGKTPTPITHVVPMGGADGGGGSGGGGGGAGGGGGGGGNR